MKTLGEVLKLTQKFLEEQHILLPRKSAEELLSHQLKMSRLDLYLNFEMPLHEKELQSLRESLKRRAKGEPVEYIFGEMKFHELQLTVNPSVLIPRQETEILLSKIIERLKTADLKEKIAWDLCSGSGCLGLGLKKALPDLHLILADISERALEVAKANSVKNGLQVDFLQGDLLEPFQGKKADFILCNPPYISQKDYETLSREVRDFEPKEALLGGPNGNEFYKRLADVLPSFLNPGAHLFFEIGFDQGNTVKEIFSSSQWKGQIVEKDWAGHDRFFSIQYFP